jgi:hypothetical protein
MDDLDEFQVYIFVLDDWVRIAMTDLLGEIAKSTRSGPRSFKSAVEAFDDLMRAVVRPALGEALPPGRPDSSADRLADEGDIRPDFLSRAVLAQLGLDSLSGPLLLGTEEWAKVQCDFRSAMVAATQSSAVESAGTNLRSGSRPPSLLRTSLQLCIRHFNRLAGRAHACIERQLNALTMREREADRNIDLTPGDASFSAHPAPAYPPIAKCASGTADESCNLASIEIVDLDTPGACTQSGTRTPCIRHGRMIKGKRREQTTELPRRDPN